MKKLFDFTIKFYNPVFIACIFVLLILLSTSVINFEQFHKILSPIIIVFVIVSIVDIVSLRIMRKRQERAD